MENVQKPVRGIIKHEWILFYIFITINLIPAVRYSFFPSADGPAHLYNARLIQHLLSGSSDLLHQYYKFNNEIVPNWGGHFILTCLISVFPANLASKIFIGLGLFFLPVSFRYCVKKLNPEGIWISYLIFPFTYSFMLCMGFYNFFIGLAILFFAIGKLVDYRNKPIKISSLLILFVLITTAYLCHLFVFLSLGMFIFFLFSIDLLQSFLVPACRNEIVKKALWLLLVSALPLALTIHYFSHAHGNNDKVYLLKTELLAWLTNCRSIICYNVEDESTFSTFVFLTVMFLFSIAFNRRIIEFIDHLKHQRQGIRSIVSGIQVPDVFLALLFVFMILYFKLPDSNSSAGFISSRLNLMLFLFAILWISNMNYSKWTFLLIVGVVSFSQYKLLKAHDHVFSDLNHEASEIMCIEPAVKANSVVLPVNYSKNRLTGHNSNYLGINKPLVIIENYECNNAYFPLSWNCKQDMFDLAHSNWSRLDQILDNTKPETLRNVDYIFVQGKKEFPDSLKARVLQQYGIAKETDNFLLLEKK